MTDANVQHLRGLPASAHRDPLVFSLLSFALPGFLATALIALGSLGVGWLPLASALYDTAVVDALRNTTAGTWLSRLMVATGVALLLQTWLVLGADLMAGLRLRFSTQALILVAWTAPLLLSAPLFSRDVYAYLAQGRLLAEGYDPYSVGVSRLPGWFIEGVDPMWGETPSPYGPLFLTFARGVANFVGDQAFLAAVMFRLFAVAGVVAMLFIVPRLAEHHGIDGTKAVWLAVLNPLVIMHFVAGGHNDAVMVALVLAAFLAGANRQIALAAAGIALAASIKPIAILALPFIGIMRTPVAWSWGQRIVDWVYVTVICGAVFVATAVIAGVGFGWVNALATPGTVKTWLSPMTAIGMALGGVTQSLGWSQTNEVPVAIMRAIGMVVWLALVTWLAILPQGRSAARGAGLALLAVVFFGPVVQPWYLLWVLPLLVVTGLSARQLRVTLLLTTALAVHGMIDGSSTSDSLLEVSNGVSILLSVGVVGLILLASPRERALVLQQDVADGLLPESTDERIRAELALVGEPERRGGG
jgi:hypothetical protein